jgi:Tfp pilus assembly protein PilO
MIWKLTRGVAPKPWVMHAIGGSVALGVVVAFYQFVHAPMRSDVADRTKRIELVRQLSTQGEQVAEQHRMLSSRLETLNEAVLRSHRRIPTKVAPASFVSEATRLAEDFGMEVRQTQTGVPQHHSTHSTVDVSYQLVGSYASTCRYLAAIDQVSQVTRILRLDLARSRDSEGYPLQVTFQLYYLTDPNDKDEQRGTL